MFSFHWHTSHLLSGKYSIVQPEGKKRTVGVYSDDYIIFLRLLWNWIMESGIFQLQWHWNRVSAMAGGTELQVGKTWLSSKWGDTGQLSLPRYPSPWASALGRGSCFQFFLFICQDESLCEKDSCIPPSDTGPVELYRKNKQKWRLLVQRTQELLATFPKLYTRWYSPFPN